VTAVDRPPAQTAQRKRRPFYFRAGALHQESNPGDTDIQLPAGLPIAPAQMTDSGVEMIDHQIPLAIIVGYTLPILGDRLSLETILGFPVEMEFRATGALANESLAPTVMGLPTGIEPLGPQLGEATFATPLLTAVYRLPDLGPITPLVGAGGMVLFAYGEKITNPVLNEAGDPKLAISPAVGLVLQGGVEIRVWRRLTARIDAKYIAGMTVEARVEDIKVIPRALPQLGTIDVGTAVLTAELAPFVVQAGLGASF
jgi:hypothetical protein